MPIRLLDAETLQLRSFEENAVSPYTILSHTWGTDEVSFQDIQGPNATSKAGYAKIKYACEDALVRGISYVWVDTCCIDKTSSAELSEAINSMHRWYENARVCYAYLADVPAETDVRSSGSAFATSRWFSRGWTLQELLAPENLYFFTNDGQQLGSKHGLSKEISEITGIGERFLTGQSRLSQASIARRMSWASRRETTRTEDLAYCLLGIFGITMPLLYGEGKKAFVRLQEEIMKTSADQTLFAWGYKDRDFQASNRRSLKSYSPFATKPAAFRDSGDFVPDELDECMSAYAMTNRGLQMNLPIVKLSRYENWGGCNGMLAVFACRPEMQFLWVVAVPIRFYSPDSITRLGSGKCLIIRRDEMIHYPTQALRLLTNIDKKAPMFQESSKQRFFLVRKLPTHDSGLCIWNVEPRSDWDSEQRVFRVVADGASYVVIRLWRSKGEGFAIAVTVKSTSGGKFLSSYMVLPETSDLPLSYESLSPKGGFGYGNSGCPDIEVKAGNQDVLMSTGITIRTLDIEAAASQKNRILQQTGTTNSA